MVKEVVRSRFESGTDLILVLVDTWVRMNGKGLW